jgi:hypothetical protein
MRDAYGTPVERHISTGDIYPCRHCLGEIPAGKPYLILAHRPFASQNAFAETGPIFLCATPCARAHSSDKVPGTLRADQFIERGYDENERIIYGTGGVTPTPNIPSRARVLLADPSVAFVDIRSAANTCFQCRIKHA